MAAAGAALEIAAEAVGVVADIDRNDGILGHLARHRGEHRDRVDTLTAIFALALVLLRPPDLPAPGCDAA